MNTENAEESMLLKREQSKLIIDSILDEFHNKQIPYDVGIHSLLNCFLNSVIMSMDKQQVISILTLTISVVNDDYDEIRKKLRDSE